MSYTMAQHIGRYEIVSTIGKGAAGSVYLAREPETGGSVAVETVELEGPRADEGREHALERARLAAGLAHANIASTYDVGSEGAVVYAAREYVDGQSLSQFIVEGAPFRPVAVLAWLTQLAAALDFAHEQGFVHGGLEPGRVLVSRTGSVKVTGFGFARAAAHAAQPAAPYYMAPEQIRGEEYDARADVYAFGAIIYELVTGHAPFESDSIVTSIFRAVNEPPVPPISLVPDLAEEIDSLLMRALEKQPEARFASCGELLEAFRAIAEPPVSAVAAAADTPGAGAAAPDEGDAAATRFCDQCGAALRPNVKFCYRCGAQTVAADELYDTGDLATDPGAGQAPAETVGIGAPDTGPSPLETISDAPRPATVVAVAPPAANAGSPAIPYGEPRPPSLDGATPSGALPPPLARYARSTGSAELPAPGEELSAPPQRSGWLGVAVTLAVVLTILGLFVLLGYWYAPRFLAPRGPQTQETSALLVQHRAPKVAGDRG